MSVIAISDIRKGLHDWIHGVTGKTAILANQNAPRPALPYYTWSENTIAKVGEDYANNNEVVGNRDFTVSVQGFGNGVLSGLEDLRTSLGKPSVQIALRAKSIIVVDSGAVNDLTGLDDTKWVERSQCDFIFRTSAEVTTGDGIIETVEVHETIKDLDSRTIVADLITITAIGD